MIPVQFRLLGTNSGYRINRFLNNHGPWFMFLDKPAIWPKWPLWLSATAPRKTILRSKHLVKSGPIGDVFERDQANRNNLLNDYDFVKDYDYLTGFDTQGRDTRCFPNKIYHYQHHLLLTDSGYPCYRVLKIRILRIRNLHQ